MRQLRVLIACEFSGVVREAFRKRGYDAWSCDLIPCTDGSPYHFQNDVRVIIPLGWDLMIAHPPCTRLTNSGVKHLYIGGKKANGRDEGKWEEMVRAALFFKDIHESPHVECVASENPIMHGYAEEIIGSKPDQIVQPYEFGHPEMKSTAFRLRNLPPLAPTNNVYEEMMKLPKRERQRIHFESPGVKNGLTRGQRRSITFPGIAEAMAEQWGRAVTRYLTQAA